MLAVKKPKSGPDYGLRSQDLPRMQNLIVAKIVGLNSRAGRLSNSKSCHPFQNIFRSFDFFGLFFKIIDTLYNSKGQILTFSSYPGLVYSGDDFTLTSSGLAITETTIGNSNKALWNQVKPHGQVLEGFRSMVATRLANSGKKWSQIFARRNSGTYNNQWMVVDYKRFKPGKPLSEKGLLWVLEQLPGHIHMEDMTKVLVAKTYWPSYNTPYFKDIFEMSGSPANVAKFGDWFTYDKTPRALIFKRDHRFL
jgi:hypothetical protein